MGAAALYGASKLMGKTPFEHEGSLPGKRSSVPSHIGPNAKSKSVAKRSKTFTDGVMKLDRKDLPEKRNMKSIFVGEDGSITKGLNKYENKKAYTGRNKTKDKSNFFQKYILGPKFQPKEDLTATMGSNKKGGILKAKGGVEVKTRLNGKLYTQTF